MLKDFKNNNQCINVLFILERGRDDWDARDINYKIEEALQDSKKNPREMNKIKERQSTKEESHCGSNYCRIMLLVLKERMKVMNEEKKKGKN